MGLDVYAGTLTRYFARDWETAVETWARENGYAFSLVDPDGNPVEGRRPEAAEQAVRWRDAVLKAVSPAGKTWSEEPGTPYFTDKPGWDAFGALLLVAACARRGEEPPPTVAAGWDFSGHPLIRSRMESKGAGRGSLFAGAQWWLPFDEVFAFSCQDPAGEERILSTTAALRGELEEINAAVWRAGSGAILEWSAADGDPGRAPDAPGAGNLYRTDAAARFAFSILYRALEFSREHGVPVLLDG